MKQKKYDKNVLRLTKSILQITTLLLIGVNQYDG